MTYCRATNGERYDICCSYSRFKFYQIYDQPTLCELIIADENYWEEVVISSTHIVTDELLASQAVTPMNVLNSLESMLENVQTSFDEGSVIENPILDSLESILLTINNPVSSFDEDEIRPKKRRNASTLKSKRSERNSEEPRSTPQKRSKRDKATHAMPTDPLSLLDSLEAMINST